MIPKDKQYHFMAGFFIYLISAQWFLIGFDLIPVIAIGTAKEVYDYVTKKGTPDINDLLFTIYGAIPLFILKIFLP